MKGKVYLAAGCAALATMMTLFSGCAGKTESAGGNEPVIETAGSALEAALQTPEPTAAPKEDWSTKYEDYFLKHPLMNKVLEVEEEEDGLKIAIRFSFGQTDNVVYVKYVVWEGSAKRELDTSEEKNYVTLYLLENGEGYMETVMKGKKTDYQKYTGINWNEAAELSQTDNPMGLGDDLYENMEYDREETIDGVVYDVLVSKALRQTKSKANRWVKYYFFINRLTQELEKCQMKDATEVTECIFSPLDEEVLKVLPEEMKGGKKMKTDEFVLRYGIAIAKITYNAMGLDPDKFNFEAAAGLR